MNTLLTSDTIYLRALEPEDIALLFALENDTTSWDVSNTIVPYSRHVLEQYLIALTDIYQSKELRLMIVDKPSNQPLGAIDLTEFDPLHLRAMVGIIILPAHRRKGYALQALKLLQTYCFSFLHLNQLYAYIPVTNRGSLKLFEQSQFQLCGTLKQWLRREDHYEDVNLMHCLAPAVRPK